MAEALGSVGATINFESNTFRVIFTARCLKENIDLVVNLITEQLKFPLFSLEDFETVKKRFIGELEQKKQCTYEYVFYIIFFHFYFYFILID